MKNFLVTILGITLILCSSASFGQENKVQEMKLLLNDDGSHYIKWTFLNQVWMRYNQSNPGTMVLNEPASETFDIGLRRTRIQFFGQLNDHVFFYSQLGQNNFNFLSQNSGNRKLQLFFHDALGEYNVWKNISYLKLGAGLTITNGLSRFSQPSVSTIMTTDVPVFAQATVDQTDEFSRKLSVYARGQIGKLDYRVALSDPFPITTNGTTSPPIGSVATFAQQGHHKQYQAFFIYNFLDKETHTTPYMTGTYLGKKKILNLEAGFITQKNAMWTRETAASDTVLHSMNLWSVAMFYDAPLNEFTGTAISAYAGYFDYDFGSGYLRYNGSMNPANGLTNGPAPGSQGNAFPMFGTGNILYSQIGYLCKRDLLGKGKGTLMPYASFIHANYERLNDPVDVWDIGVNWLISSHNSKLSLDYQNRPVFTNELGGLSKHGSRSQIALQFQTFF